MTGRGRRDRRSCAGGLVLAVLLATAAERAEAQGTEPGPAPPPPAAREPSLGIVEAQLFGAASGLVLGAGLARRPAGPVPTLRPLRGADAILAGSAVALYLGAEILAHKRPAPTDAGTTPIGEINAFDRKIRRLAVGRRSFEKRRLLDHLSYGTAMVNYFQPVGMLFAADVPNRWSRDVPVLAEAMALTLSVNAFVKHLSHRSRPEAHFCESEEIVVPCAPDTRLSFYSGHTSSAFVAAVAAGTLADFHHLENRRWIWATGLTFATGTGVLRIMADQHYATDVLTGVAAGSLAGWLIPKLHEPDPVSTTTTAAVPPTPTALAALPVPLPAGRGVALVTVGSFGGGPYVGLRWQW